MGGVEVGGEEVIGAAVFGCGEEGEDGSAAVVDAHNLAYPAASEHTGQMVTAGVAAAAAAAVVVGGGVVVGGVDVVARAREVSDISRTGPPRQSDGRDVVQRRNIPDQEGERGGGGGAAVGVSRGSTDDPVDAVGAAVAAHTTYPGPLWG